MCFRLQINTPDHRIPANAAWRRRHHHHHHHRHQNAVIMPSLASQTPPSATKSKKRKQPVSSLHLQTTLSVSIVWKCQRASTGISVDSEPVERPPYPILRSGRLTYAQRPHVTYAKNFLGTCRCMTVVVCSVRWRLKKGCQKIESQLSYSSGGGLIWHEPVLTLICITTKQDL